MVIRHQFSAKIGKADYIEINENILPCSIDTDSSICGKYKYFVPKSMTSFDLIQEYRLIHK